tara:strand:+ start:1246 stop:2094 length:849 start_codon:yes stop_codon:yes gene_type:complete
MNYNQITIGIVTYRSEKVIFNCLKSIKKIKKIIILDNSNDNILKKKILKRYPNIKVFLSQKNLGYGEGNNFILKKSKTPFVYILSPDVILKKNCEKNLLKTIKNLNNNFSILSPISGDKNYGTKIKKPVINKDFFEVDFVKGFAMLVNKKKIINIGMFDKKIFLYLEEIDLCKRLKQVNEKIYVSKFSKVSHLAAKSSNIGFEYEKCRNWHWMWSKVYFQKKFSNNLFVYLKFIPILIFQLFKILFYQIAFNQNKKTICILRFSGTYSSLIGQKSWYRPKKL